MTLVTFSTDRTNFVEFLLVSKDEKHVYSLIKNKKKKKQHQDLAISQETVYTVGGIVKHLTIIYIR